MTTSSLRRVLLGAVALCMVVPSLALASGTPGGGSGPKFCTFQGTWFGVNSPTNLTLTGWMVTVEGASLFSGTNNLEFPTFDPRVPIVDPMTGKIVGYAFQDADRMSTLRGIWQRTGLNTFSYSFTGFGLQGQTPLYIAKVAGTIELSRDCRTEKITAAMSLYSPDKSPFTDEPLYPPQPLADHYGYRY